MLENPRRTLEAGVYGTKGGDVVLPTIWASLGTIREGASTGTNTQPPTPDVYSQILETANSAEKIAQSVRDDADAGKFNGKPGDSPYIGENGNWFIGNNDTGVSATGPQGPAGDTGPQGQAGPEGPQGPTGPIGPQGPEGPEGPRGEKGDTGSEGLPGTDGGYYTPSVDGEGNLSWTASKGEMPSVNVANIRGPQGEQGAQGTTGPEGPQGPQGLQGPPGEGVPEGGTEGQILSKTTDGTAWVDPPQSGVQPDWNQNDPEAADYVKNRPGGYTVTEELFNQTVSILRVSSGISYFTYSTTVTFIEGESYIVVFDSETYKCVAYSFENTTAIGNQAIAGNSDDASNEPFFLSEGMGATTKSGDSHTLKISRSTIQTFDAAFIPQFIIDPEDVGLEESVLFSPEVEAKMPTDISWSSIAFGNGRFVAVGHGSSVSGGNRVAAYSDDGITWTQITLPASEKWTAVAFGNGRFVAV